MELTLGLAGGQGRQAGATEAGVEIRVVYSRKQGREE